MVHPDDFHAFIDAAHALGASVVLDIVLNHFGPEGNYLPLLLPAFFHQDRMAPWGNGIAYEVEAVRQYIAEAPLFWLSGIILTVCASTPSTRSMTTLRPIFFRDSATDPRRLSGVGISI